MWGPLAGLGAFVESSGSLFYMDNANLRKAPGYELVNLNVHYNTDEVRLLQVEHVCRSQERVRPDLYRVRQQHRKYGHAGVQGPRRTGSIYAGSPRAFMAGMKLAFK